MQFPPLTDPEGRALLAAALEAPADDASRFALADWLEERGDPRAAWVRDVNLLPFMAPDLRDPMPALIAALDATDDDARQCRAEYALRTIGPSAVGPVLVWVRADPDARW